MYLKPGFEKVYEKRHAEIWPELKKLLKESDVNDYSIDVNHCAIYFNSFSRMFRYSTFMGGPT